MWLCPKQDDGNLKCERPRDVYNALFLTFLGSILWWWRDKPTEGDSFSIIQVCVPRHVLPEMRAKCPKIIYSSIFEVLKILSGRAEAGLFLGRKRTAFGLFVFIMDNFFYAIPQIGLKFNSLYWHDGLRPHLKARYKYCRRKRKGSESVYFNAIDVQCRKKRLRDAGAEAVLR